MENFGLRLMAMKTVICLSFIVLNNFFANMCQGRYLGGGRRRRRPPKQNSPQNCPAYPLKLLLPLQQFQDGGFFFRNQPRLRKKVDHIGAMTFFFYINRELGEN